MKGAWARVLVVLCVFGVLCAAAVPPGSAMELTVVMPGGQVIKVAAEPQDTIEQVKQKVYSASELSPLNQVMFKGGKELDNKQLLSAYSIKDGDTLIVRHGIIGAPTRKSDSGTLWIVLGFLAIIGTGIFFMRKKPSGDTDLR
jgi:hypothetical protein